MYKKIGYISLGKEQLHYLQMGTGKRLLLAFHGYANDASIFLSFGNYLQQDYTVLSFDLPHHGNSKWKPETIFTKENLLTLLKSLEIAYGVSKISLLGYSMGGRVCLSVIEAIPDRIDKVTLIAADGLTSNSYYYFFTRNFLGKKLFRNVLEKPEPYFKILDWLKKKNLLDSSRHKFVMRYLEGDENRKFLSQVWMAMSLLIPNLRKVKAAIKRYHIHISVFMGSYDKIMPPALGEKFKDGLETVKLYILEKGHRVFDADNTELIAKSLI